MPRARATPRPARVPQPTVDWTLPRPNRGSRSLWVGFRDVRFDCSSVSLAEFRLNLNTSPDIGRRPRSDRLLAAAIEKVERGVRSAIAGPDVRQQVQLGTPEQPVLDLVSAQQAFQSLVGVDRVA